MVRSKQQTRDTHKEGKNSFLLGSLLLLMVFYPFLIEGALRYALLNLIISVVLIAGIYASSYEKRHFVYGLLFGIPALIANWATVVSPSPLTALIAVIFALPFYIYTTITLFLSILRSKHIHLNQIYGAISVYLLIGITWGYIYGFIEKLHPGSFFFGPNANYMIAGPDLLYYSFITLTTVGYGDIVPLTTYARTFAVLEAVFGVFYTAILISRLVSAYHPETEEE